MGRPTHIEAMRKLSGGKCCTPSFITGQLMPQIRVSAISKKICRAVKGGIGRRLCPRAARPPGCPATSPREGRSLKSRPMTFLDMLRNATAQNQSMLCVGLDPEPSRFPAAMRGDASKIYDFCAAIVDATADLVNSFKPQIAYFAAHRAEDQLEKLMAHMRAVAPHVPIILDARSEEHTSELQSPCNLVCRLLLEKKNTVQDTYQNSTSTS